MRTTFYIECAVDLRLSAHFPASLGFYWKRDLFLKDVHLLNN